MPRNRRPLRFRGVSQRQIDAYERRFLPRLRRVGRGLARLVIEPFDFLVGWIWLAAGLGFATFLALNGASAVEIGLVVLLTVIYGIYWAYTSWALDWWRDRR